MRISDWSSDVCSSDLVLNLAIAAEDGGGVSIDPGRDRDDGRPQFRRQLIAIDHGIDTERIPQALIAQQRVLQVAGLGWRCGLLFERHGDLGDDPAFQPARSRSEEHTSELQSLMRISYAVFCLKPNRSRSYTIRTQS